MRLPCQKMMSLCVLVKMETSSSSRKQQLCASLVENEHFVCILNVKHVFSLSKTCTLYFPCRSLKLWVLHVNNKAWRLSTALSVHLGDFHFRCLAFHDCVIWLTRESACAAAAACPCALLLDQSGSAFDASVAASPDHHQPPCTTVESAPLVERLVEDLTASHARQAELAALAERRSDELSVAEQHVLPIRKENARLVRENNELHMQVV